MRVTQAQGYEEPRDSLSHDWLTTLIGWGMTPLPIPNIGPTAIEYVKEFNPGILILSGGEDIGTDPIRDETETALLRYALSSGLPVLGVCRGMQLINDFSGGAINDISGHVATIHSITFAPEWQAFYGSECDVNSYHNRCVEAASLAPNLYATAYDTLGNIEGFIHVEKPLAAVMWHPERAGASDGDKELVQSLIEMGDAI